MLQTGKYKFLATFPGIYKERPITHYHVKVSSKGVNDIPRNTIFGEGAYCDCKLRSSSSKGELSEYCNYYRESSLTP